MTHVATNCPIWRLSLASRSARLALALATSSSSSSSGMRAKAGRGMLNASGATPSMPSNARRFAVGAWGATARGWETRPGAEHPDTIVCAFMVAITRSILP
ncbi:hypothetical protein F751_2064 [Auxenochlorella protothecoides]|uniref:Uncharacterized protein n=1 Tax=Auxenochlorella protothecoides TaxID=3075 RepID=A0A087SMM4_AUXPR|nr:hypothetical protein F751_2064 [Auxenochlorella protothecoides]KFM26978.1 hypothetical protein F751_2064 [Auxenochlorella protothecoides]